jgi:hypothetical protein
VQKKCKICDKKFVVRFYQGDKNDDICPDCHDCPPMCERMTITRKTSTDMLTNQIFPHTLHVPNTEPNIFQKMIYNVYTFLFGEQREREVLYNYN